MIGIIEYNMGNIQSVVNALEYLGEKVSVISQPHDLDSVDKIILPGVGAFGVGINNLKERGFYDRLNKEVLDRKKPFLGICLGMQLVCRESYEFGHHQGLGWINASVNRFNGEAGLRVPHVGWNDLIIKKPGMIVGMEDNGQDVYFVHSYCVADNGEQFIAAACHYGSNIAAVIEQDNVYATQFHPEKSQAVGLRILNKFAKVGKRC